ncbi:P-loop containing nucleoside triphosphate hydrolase [Phytophthora cactorum]|nr:P-loop containing nucleoside triphosphate hydrolase [Phytophthora cactorum]
MQQHRLSQRSSPSKTRAPSLLPADCSSTAKGHAGQQHRAQLIENGNSTDDQESASTGGLTASYIQSVIAQVEDGLDSQECPICLDPPQNAVLTPCAHVLCDQCLRDSLANDPDNGCPVCELSVKAITSTADDDGTGFESAKLQQLLRDLQAIKLENENAESPEQKRKVVVFSQWTSMLEMVSQLLTRHNFSHCTFNGGLTQEARERSESCGVGLNLTCASVVILLDPWWNPGVEEQAVDRVHRLGQTQDVIVKRYVVNDTVEDMILQLQQRKEKLAKHVLVVAKADDERRSERLNLDDLRSFFR